MRVVLMHNPTAGDEDHAADELVEWIRRAGHEVVREVTRRKELEAALAEEEVDLVAVAGGDGTIGKAADVLARTGVPFAVLPLGTANNVAHSLGVHGALDELIAAWSRGVPRGFDRARVRRGDDEAWFVEALGFGAFPEVTRRVDGQELDAPDGRLEQALAAFEDVLATLRPARYTISADGDDLSGEYLLVEVMNVAWLGPRVPIALPADPGDGHLDLVLAGEAERAALLDHLADLRRGGVAPAPLPERRVRRVVIAARGQTHHLDGDLVERRAKPPPRDHFDVEVEPHALQVWLPRGV